MTFDRDPPRPRRFRLAHGAALAGLVVIGLGAAALTRPDHRFMTNGDGMTIEVVQPVEPKVQPGDKMGVGDLVDGFHYAPPAAAPTIEEVDYRSEDGYDANYEAPPPPQPTRVRYREEAEVYPPPAPRPVERYGSDDRSFGFDAPRRDFRAEREARRARLDALADRSSERERFWRSEGPDPRYEPRPDRRDPRYGPRPDRRDPGYDDRLPPSPGEDAFY